MKKVLVVAVVSMMLTPGTAEAMPTTSQTAPIARASSVWSVLRCGAAVGAFIAGNGLLISKVRKVGGLWKVAKKLWRAKGAQRKWEVAVGLFGYVSGIGALVEGCS